MPAKYSDFHVDASACAASSSLFLSDSEPCHAMHTQAITFLFQAITFLLQGKCSKRKGKGFTRHILVCASSPPEAALAERRPRRTWQPLLPFKGRTASMCEYAGVSKHVYSKGCGLSSWQCTLTSLACNWPRKLVSSKFSSEMWRLLSSICTYGEITPHSCYNIATTSNVMPT